MGNPHPYPEGPRQITRPPYQLPYRTQLPSWAQVTHAANNSGRDRFKEPYLENRFRTPME